MDKTFSPYRKRLNTQIIKKTQIALQAIKKHDEEQSRLTFYNNSKFNPSQMLSQIESDYKRHFPSKKVQLQKTYNMNMFAHQQQFYYLPMRNHSFPIRIFIKNVQNQGVLFVGYDRQHPGVKNQKKDQIEDSNQVQNENLYDYKAIINKQLLVTLKNKQNKDVKAIYFTFQSHSSLLMFRFKIDSLGIQKELKSFSQAKLKKQKKILDQSLDKSREQTLLRQNTEPISILRSTNTMLPSIAKIADKSVSISKEIRKNSIDKQKVLPNFNKTLIIGTNKTLKSNKFFTGISLQKSDFLVRLQQVKKNRNLLQIYKQKDKQLRETASRCKKLIQSYKKTYNEQNIRKGKLNKNILMTMYSIMYLHKVHSVYFIKKRHLALQQGKFSLCKRFIRNLKNKITESNNMMFPRGKRLNFQSYSSIVLSAKLIQKHSSLKASSIIKDVLLFLKPIFSINKSLVAATVYRDKIKFIQRVWKIKYNNRMYCLLYFADNHVQQMLKQYPHFKLFFQSFYKKGANRQICLNYMKDQSEKYRYIYKGYIRRLQQIDQIIMTKKASPQKSNKKEKLMIPKKPIKPMHRFYRNCDILKSMIRTWFQIQYKKYSKKNMHILLK